MYLRYYRERRDVASVMRRLYDRGLTTASGGNVSLRAGNRFIITPSGTDKGLIRPGQVAVITMEGENLTPGLNPSMETLMHLEIYRARPDIRAVVHAHPVFTSSFAATGRTINCSLIGEARAVLQTPVVTGYELMGTPELARQAAGAAGEGNSIILKNHGAICLGNTILQAFDRMEVLETAARMTVITGFLGDVQALSREDIAAIDRLFGFSS